MHCFSQVLILLFSIALQVQSIRLQNPSARQQLATVSESSYPSVANRRKHVRSPLGHAWQPEDIVLRRKPNKVAVMYQAAKDKILKVVSCCRPRDEFMIEEEPEYATTKKSQPITNLHGETISEGEIRPVCPVCHNFAKQQATVSAPHTDNPDAEMKRLLSKRSRLNNELNTLPLQTTDLTRRFSGATTGSQEGEFNRRVMHIRNKRDRLVADRKSVDQDLRRISYEQSLRR